MRVGVVNPCAPLPERRRSGSVSSVAWSACKSASTEKTGLSSGIALPAAEMAAVGSRTSITGGSAPAGTILPTKSLHASCTEAMASSGFSRFYGACAGNRVTARRRHPAAAAAAQHCYY